MTTIMAIRVRMITVTNDDDDDDDTDDNDDHDDGDGSDGDDPAYDSGDDSDETSPPRRCAVSRRAAADCRVLSLRQRREATPELYAQYNESVFRCELPGDLSVLWSKKLRTTAGFCAFSTRCGVRVARIELSVRVVDTIDKLRQTLMHEMCHAAAFLIDGCSSPPHGAVFRKWAAAAHRRHPRIVVTTCHSYAIHHRHRYRCSRCHIVIGRHTASIDVTKKQCRCGGAIVYDGAFNADGTAVAAKSKTVNKFAEFVRAYSADVRRVYPHTPNRARLGLLSAAYKQRDVTTNKLTRRFSALLLE